MNLKCTGACLPIGSKNFKNIEDVEPQKLGTSFPFFGPEIARDSDKDAD